MAVRNGCCGPNPCFHYDFKLQRCRLGYVNPKTIREGVNAAKQGLLKPCPFTTKGEKVIEKLKKEEEHG